MTKRAIRRTMMNSSVPTIIVDARLASVTVTTTTRTTSTSPTTRTNRSDNVSIETVSSLGSIVPNAHFLAALRLAADRKVLRAPGSSRRRPPVLAPKPWTSSQSQASRIASRITTRLRQSREPQSDGLARAETECRHVCRHSNSPETSNQQIVKRSTAAAVRVSRSKSKYSGVDNLDSEFTRNKDRHSSAAGGGKSTPVNDWPPLQAAAQEMLTEVTQQSAAEPRLSDADMREAIQLLMDKRAREQQQKQQQQQQQGEPQKQKQPPMAPGGGLRPRRMAAQREVEMACGFGDCVKDDGSDGGGKKSGSLRLIVCIPKSDGVSTQSWEEPVYKPEQMPTKLEAGAKLKVELSRFEPSMVLEAAEENSDTPVHAKLNVLEVDDGLSLPGVELWRDSSSCVHNAEVLEANTAVLTGSLAVATQEEPKQLLPKTRASNLLIGKSLKESMLCSLDYERMQHVKSELMKEQRKQEISNEEEKMRILQQELMEEWKEQKARDSKGDVASADGSDEGGFYSGTSEGVDSSDENSDDIDEIEGGTELNTKTNSMLSVLSKDSSFFPKPKKVPVEFTQEDILGPDIGPDGQALPAGSFGLLGLGNVEVMERRKELLQRLSKIQMPIVSCPAAVIGHQEDHPERTELAKELVMNLQPAEDQQVVVQAARFAWQNLNLKRPLRLNQYRRCSEDNEQDNRSDDSFMH